MKWKFPLLLFATSTLAFADGLQGPQQPAVPGQMGQMTQIEARSKDVGATDLGVKMSNETLTGVMMMLKAARDEGRGMPEPDDLMPAQEALQWISRRTYLLEPTAAWPTPEMVEQRAWSDCKGKAIWLADRLLRLGYKDVKIVVGKVPDLLTGHAWVELVFPLDKKGRRSAVYILDGTYRGRYSIITKDQNTVHSDHAVVHVITPDNYSR